MTSTAISLDDDQLARLAKGHSGDGSEAPPTGYGPASPLAAASALRSSANDLLTFLEANVGEPVNDLELAMRMTHRARSDFSSDRDVGLNWFVTTVGDHRIVWHGGDTLGYSTFLGFDPDREMGVVLLTNSAAQNKDIGMHLLNRNVPLATPRR